MEAGFTSLSTRIGRDVIWATDVYMQPSGMIMSTQQDLTQTTISIDDGYDDITYAIHSTVDIRDR